MKRTAYAIAHSGIALALGAGGAILTTQIFMGAPLQLDLFFAIVLVTYGSYNINRLTDTKEDEINNPDRLKFYKNTLVKISTIFAFIIAGWIALGKGLTGIILLAVFPFSVIIYSTKIFPRRVTKYTRLKEIPLVKNLTSAIVWAFLPFVAALFPGYKITTPVYATSLLVFLRFFINTLSFDIRDIRGDAISGIKTLPASFGKNLILNYLRVVNIFATLILILLIATNSLPLSALGLLPFTLYAEWFLNQIKIGKIDKPILYQIIIDGEFFLWPIFVQISSILFH